MAAPDRLQALLNQNVVTGIDFVYVYEDQVTLDVFFLRPPDTLTVPLVNDPNFTAANVRVYSPSGGEGLPEIPVVPPVAWGVVDGRAVLRLTATMPGDFTRYHLHLDDPRLDRYYNDVPFSFKANCPSDLDCEPPPHLCLPEDDVDFPIDYRARDFWSFRRALLEFASQRYPDWQDRLEADMGVMLVEVMSALGDEMAYYQDQIWRQAYLETATQRRSVRHHARLVDYHLHDGLGASTWIEVTVRPGQAGALIAGADLWATADNGRQIPYEVGRNLADVLDGRTFVVAATRNSFQPHLWDEDDTCLPIGSNELFIEGHHTADLTFDFPPENPQGKWLLLRTEPTDRGIQARRWLVRLLQATDIRDEVLGQDITHLVWDMGQALPFELDMEVLTVHANLVPVIAGQTSEAYFLTGEDPSALGLPSLEEARVTRAVERVGANQTTTYRFTLPDDENLSLVWEGPKPEEASPALHLQEVSFDGINWLAEGEAWQWRRSLLGVSSSQPYDRHFTLDDGTWGRVARFQRIGSEFIHADYAANEGMSIRFGDGQFGLIPAEATIFRACYRLGNGESGNLSADTITYFDPALNFVEAVTNPLPISSGQEPESLDRARQLAPDAFRALTFRAVRPEDYAEAAERLDWVTRAGATARWTGSWLTIFAAADPQDAVTISPAQQAALTHQLDRFRQAGREAYPVAPRYANLDLEITVCVEPYAYRGDVKEAVLLLLLGRPGQQQRTGFFDPDNFTFGTPFYRTELEAAIQTVPGVRAVEAIAIRRRGWFDWRPFTEFIYQVALDEVIRVENDPLHPARGSVRLVMEGGA